jgi:hypothetical protein
MTTEKNIRRVLDLLTTAPAFHIESLEKKAMVQTFQLRDLVTTKNIIGMGIARKQSESKKDRGKLALTFYVREKVPLEDLSNDQAIPRSITGVLEGETGIITDVVELGEMLPQVNFARTPIQPGNSISHHQETAGTLGAIVKRGKQYFSLSNSHVLAQNGTASIGDAVLYPGPADSGLSPGDAIGELVDFIAFINGPDFPNQSECAIASIGEAHLSKVICAIKGQSLPKGTIRARRGMKVYKVGRSSDFTEGIIRDVDFHINVPYNNHGIGEIGFIKQILCTKFTDAGDSGSLVIDQKTGKAVGLHFCGGITGSVSSPIGKVLKSLKVRLVTEEIASHL